MHRGACVIIRGIIAAVIGRAIIHVMRRINGGIDNRRGTINRHNDIISAVDIRIANNLNLFIVHHDGRHILKFTLAQCGLDDNYVNIFFKGFHYTQIINESIIV
jgi:hypothetical protein